jgi:hypothetical protein
MRQVDGRGWPIAWACANLMAAPGLRPYLQQRIASKALDRRIACDGGLALTAISSDHHARSL